MRHYEIVFLVHPDQSDQTQAVLNKFSTLVEESGGKVHRSEDIGSRKLAYPIQDQFKASYALMNIECNQDVIDEIKNSFKFNDSIIRDLILSKKKEYTETSALSKQTEEEEKKENFEKPSRKEKKEVIDTKEEPKEEPKETPAAIQEPVVQQATGDDPNVLKSEIDDIRKSVVSMSVGQPERTASIVKEWLEQPAPEPPAAPETPDDGGAEEEDEG